MSEPIAKLYTPLSAEQRWWYSRYRWFFAPEQPPTGLLAWLHRVVVVPSTVTVSFSLPYQTYLLVIFHQTLASRLGHLVGLPLGTTMALATAAQLGGPAVGWLAGGLLAAWWVAMAAVPRLWLWAVCNVFVVSAATVLAQQYVAWYGGLTDPSWMLHPVAGMLWGALCSSMSHTIERGFPPRANGTLGWMTVSEFLFTGEGLSARLVRFGEVALQGLYGTFDEWYATLRVAPILVLWVLWMLGYDREHWRTIKGWADQALASGEPALDYIGEGGGLFVPTQHL